MDNPQETLLVWERAWLAGILDGEGYIGLTNAGRVRNNKPHFRAAICIGNTDVNIIAEVVRIVRKMGIEPYIQNQDKGPGCRPAMLVWIKNMVGVATVLIWTACYIKGDKAQVLKLVYEFVMSRLEKTRDPYTAREMKLISNVLVLNKRGSSTTARDALLREMKIQSVS